VEAWSESFRKDWLEAGIDLSTIILGVDQLFNPIMTSLRVILSNAIKAQYPLLLLQSSAAQSSLPLLRRIIADTPHHTILCCLLHPPSTLVEDAALNIQVFDRTDNVPGYSDTPSDLKETLFGAVQSGMQNWIFPPSNLTRGTAPNSLNVVLDSVDTLCSDIGSVSRTYTLIHDLFSTLRTRASEYLSSGC
jgi:elongator complex protein 5